jgi:hypothetical protein
MSKKHKNKKVTVNDAWKKEKQRRDDQRVELTERRLMNFINDSANTEGIIKCVESENVALFSDVPGLACVYGSRIGTHKMILSSYTGQLHIEYGTSKKGDVVFVRLTRRPVCGGEIIGKDAIPPVVLTFASPYALEEAIAAFKTLHYLLAVEQGIQKKQGAKNEV